MVKLIDTHAHLDFDKLYNNLDEVIERARKKGVEKIINIGITVSSSQKSIEIAKNYEDIYAVIGIHPHDAKNAPENYLKELEKMAREEEVVALGEMGLDYFKDFSPRDVQMKVFKEQLSLAKDLNMPVVIHDRDAHDESIKAIKDINGLRGVFHCFSGDWKVAREVLDLGFYISFPGTITFKKAQKLREVAKKMPHDRIMVETDCPFLAPEPFRGKTNEPAYVRLVAEAVAEERGISLEDLGEITTNNAISFFGLR